MYKRVVAIGVLSFAVLPCCASSKGVEADNDPTHTDSGIPGVGGTGNIGASEGSHDGSHPGYVVPVSGGTGNDPAGDAGAVRGTEALARCSPAVCAAVAFPGSACAAEVCDGFDNDCNGVVDDVDTGNDGVCDCIRIATLGVPGTWGEGDVFGTWLSARSTNGAVHLGDRVLTASLLSEFDIVIVQNVNAVAPDDGSGGIGRSYSQEEVAALAQFVTQRGGLMTMIGYSAPSERTNVNSLLGPFGLVYGSDKILMQRNNATVAVETWHEHPISAGITAIGVDNGYEAQSVQNAGALVASQDGFQLGRAMQVGSGKVFQWGDEWITYNSEWTGHPEYQVQLFWLNVIKWLSPVNYCQVVIPPVLIN